MRTRITHQRLVVLSALCAFALRMDVYGGNPIETRDYVFQLTPAQTRIVPYEPVYLKYSLRNNSEGQQTVTGQWHIAVYVRQGEAGEWEYYDQPRKVQARPLPPRPKTFAAGETLNGIVLLDVKFRGKHVFAAPGTYWVKVKLAGMESVPVSVIVQPPSHGEEPARRYLDAHPLYLFFTEQMANESLDKLQGEDPTEELDKYVRLFPSSRYAQWATLGLLWVKKARAADDHDAVETVRRNMEKTAPDLVSPMGAMCWYEAGIVAYRLGDDIGANANFKRSIEVGERVFAGDQVEYFKRNETYIRRLK